MIKIKLTYIALKEDENKKVGNILRDKLNISSRLLTKLKMNGKILVNRTSVFSSYIVHQNDEITVNIDFEEEDNIIPEEMNLDMRFIDSYYTFDRNQLIFNFMADNRIDFRELAKRLAQLYHTRIELRQVGVRDKAKQIGGIGPCGRFLCCSTFLTDFDSVSINMAKNQYIALNPTKINGVCGRLLCCLKYEDDQYKEMKKGLPKIGQTVEYAGVKGKVSSINLLTKKMILEQGNKSFVEVDLEEK